jgi:AAA ATPase domain
VALLVERDEELAAVARLVSGGGGVVLVEGRAGIGKTALVDAACTQARALGHEVLRAQAVELEAGFAFGLVRQLFARRLQGAPPAERELLSAGPAGPAWALLNDAAGADTSFAIAYGLYWLAANLAASRPLLVAVDDAQWADHASLRWLGHLAPRTAELGASLVVASHPHPPGDEPEALLAVRREATVVLRPRLLTGPAVGVVAQQVLGDHADAQLCVQLAHASGGNPFYLRELLRAVADDGGVDRLDLLGAGREEVARHLGVRLRRLGAAATQLAQAGAVLGDGCRLRQAAALTGQHGDEALRLAVALVEADVLATPDPLRFLHPIVRDGVEAAMDQADGVALHRAAAALLHAEHAPAGRVAAHLQTVPPAADLWVCARLREAAAESSASGAPDEAADLLGRAWAEPPPVDEQVAVLRELARVEVMAGRGTARDRLEQALLRTRDPRERALIALEVAQVHAIAFRWVDAVDVLERALDELGVTAPELADDLRGRLVVAAVHDARRASVVRSTLGRLGDTPPGPSGEAVAVARGMTALLGGGPEAAVTVPLRAALRAAAMPTPDWDIRAALLWCLITADDFDVVEAALAPMLDEVTCTGAARGLIAVHSSLGFLKLRLGMLDEADSAARIAQRVMQRGDFAPGLPFAVTVRAEAALEAGQLDQAEALLATLPDPPGPAGVGTVLVPATWGRLHLAAGRPNAALTAFQTCADMFDARSGGSRCAMSATCTPAPVRPPRCCCSVSARRRAIWPRPRSTTCARSVRRGRSAWHCASRASRAAAPPGWPCWRSRWRCWRALRRCWNGPSRSPSSVRRSVGPATAPSPRRTSPRRWTWRRGTGPARWPGGRGPSSRPPAPGPGGTGVAASSR